MAVLQTRASRRGLPAISLLAALALAGCKENCYDREEPDGTADFSALRLSGTLQSAEGGGALMVFAGNTMQYSYDNYAGGQDVLIYDVAYDGTQQQIQNVKTSKGGVGTCVKYRRETWTVPTVKMTLRSATRNGQPLLADGSSTGLSTSYQEVSVTKHYVDRMRSDDYVGVQVTGTRVVDATFQISMTTGGQRFSFVPDNV